MRRRDRNAVGKGLAPLSKAKCLKITSRTVAIREEPGKYSKILCQLTSGIYAPSDVEKLVEGIMWYKLPCGWLCSMDSNGYESCVVAPDSEGQRMWAAEFDKRRRIAGAVTAMLTRSYSLDNARRVAKSINKYVLSDEMAPMMNLPDVSIEDLMVGISSASGLRQGEVLELLKIAACQQCNPPKALKDIAADVLELIEMRPTLWIKTDRNVLETLDVRSKNDQFVMAAARGNVSMFDQFLAVGQELAAVHSELKYTALHAAADFGQDQIAKRLIGMGLSTDIRDARKGQTPLHFGGQGGRSHICQLLLAAGADRSITSYKGKLAYELAADQGFVECAEILKTPPPAVQFVAITDFTTRTISLRWEPPVVDTQFAARITEYIIEWSPVGHFSVVGHGDRFLSKTPTFTLRGVRPATGHGFVILCNSPAGLSQPSSKIIQFTKPSPPDRPPTVEMLRVTTNGIYLAWLPPKHTNGAKLDRYQLELVETSKGALIEDRERQAAERRRQAKLDKLERKKLLRLSGMGPVTPLRGESSSAGMGSLGGGSNTHGDDDDDDDDGEGGDEDDEDEDEGWDEGDDEEKDEAPQTKQANHATQARGGSDQVSLSSSLKDQGSVAVPRDDAGGNDRNHRVFKVSATTLSKQCMGLELWKPYQCRVRCHNSLGYSAWSDWIGPVTPQPGVYVLDFDRENRALRVGWFKPMLSAARKVTGYEVQLCNVLGPVLATIPVFADTADKASIVARNVGLVWRTLSSDVSINEFNVQELKAGSKYQVRVRCQVDRQWLDWSLGLLSDIILMPACAPERPNGLRPALRLMAGLDLDHAEAEEAASDLVADSLEDAATATATATATTTATTTTVAAAPRSGQPASDFEITHDTIRLQWVNGISNGSPVAEYQLELCRVREYRASEVAQAEIAAGVDYSNLRMLEPGAGGGAGAEEGGGEEEDGGDNDDDEEEEEEEGEGGEEGDEEGGKEKDAQPAAVPAEPTLAWKDYSHRASLLGPQAFLVRGLFPGGSYIFRLRVRNEHGFSPWSLASPIITTFPCLPVGRPEVLKCLPYHVYLRWNEQGDGKFMGLTNLEHEVQIGKVPSGESQLTYAVSWQAADTSSAPEWGRLQQADKERHAEAQAAHATEAAAHARVRQELAALQAERAALEDKEHEEEFVDETRDERAARQKAEALQHAARQGARSEAEKRKGTGGGGGDDHDNDDDDDGPGPPPPMPKFVGVMINNLSPGTDFCARVRVRTVLGWSTWSEVSETFRTLSQNT